MELHVKRIRPESKIPVRATQGSAGFDLFACLDGAVVIPPGKRASIPTGIAVGMESDVVVGLVFARSGLAVKKGITLSNGVGVIDSDYRGEIIVGILNTSSEEFTVQNGDRIAQFVLMPVVVPNLCETEELKTTDRGAGGFGSTGTR